MDGLFRDIIVHGMKCFLRKSNESYVPCTKRNAILSFCHKVASKSYEDEILKTFIETAQSGDMSIFK